MYNVIKKKLGLATFGGQATFRGSLFSGFIRSHKVLTLLLSEGRYYRNFTVCGGVTGRIGCSTH